MADEDKGPEIKSCSLKEALSTIMKDQEKKAQQFGFDCALAALKDGFRVRRDGWNGKGMWVKLQTPTSKSMMTLPYIFMKTAQDDLVPWLASQTDILAGDWEIVK